MHGFEKHTQSAWIWIILEELKVTWPHYTTDIISLVSVNVKVVFEKACTKCMDSDFDDSDFSRT